MLSSTTSASASNLSLRGAVLHICRTFLQADTRASKSRSSLKYLSAPLGQSPMSAPFGQSPVSAPLGQSPMSAPFSQSPMSAPFGQSPNKSTGTHTTIHGHAQHIEDDRKRVGIQCSHANMHIGKYVGR